MQFLYYTIKEILDTGRVGTPVFVRCAVQVALESKNVSNVLARILTVVCSWLKASPLRLYSQSGNNSRQITVTIQHAGGQTSIVSVNAAPDAISRVDLMLLGNKGALYHDGESFAPGSDIAVEPPPVPEWLMDAVERSLRAGKPVVIEEVTDFE